MSLASTALIQQQQRHLSNPKVEWMPPSTDDTAVPVESPNAPRKRSGAKPRARRASSSAVPSSRGHGEGPDGYRQPQPLRRRDSLSKAPIAKDPRSRQSSSSSSISRKSLKALQSAAQAAKIFDRHYRSIRNVERETSIPLFTGNEIVLASAKPLRSYSYFCDYELQQLRLAMDHTMGDRGIDEDDQGPTPDDEKRQRFADRTVEQMHNEVRPYAVKYLKRGLLTTDDGDTSTAGAQLATQEMIIEAKILMNLAPHPHLQQVYGVNGDGIDSFLQSELRKSFFIITDHITDTLATKLRQWRLYMGMSSPAETDFPDESDEDPLEPLPPPPLNQRLEIANDILSALTFLHDRDLIMNLRPDKVGFDAKCHGRVKLCSFGQSIPAGSDARDEDEASKDVHSLKTIVKGIVRSDDMSVLVYTAPEVFKSSSSSPSSSTQPSCSSDVHSFGMVLYELLTLRFPFHDLGLDEEAFHRQVVLGDERPEVAVTDIIVSVVDLEDGSTEIKTSSTSSSMAKDLVDLVNTCWDPNFRPTIRKVQETLETILLFQDEDDAATNTSSTTAARMDSKPAAQLAQDRGSQRQQRSSDEGINMSPHRTPRRTRSSGSKQRLAQINGAMGAPLTPSPSASPMTARTYTTRGSSKSSPSSSVSASPLNQVLPTLPKADTTDLVQEAQLRRSAESSPAVGTRTRIQRNRSSSQRTSRTTGGDLFPPSASPVRSAPRRATSLRPGYLPGREPITPGRVKSFAVPERSKSGPNASGLSAMEFSPWNESHVFDDVSFTSAEPTSKATASGFPTLTPLKTPKQKAVIRLRRSSSREHDSTLSGGSSNGDTASFALDNLSPGRKEVKRGVARNRSGSSTPGRSTRRSVSEDLRRIAAAAAAARDEDGEDHADGTRSGHFSTGSSAGSAYTPTSNVDDDSSGLFAPKSPAPKSPKSQSTSSSRPTTPTTPGGSKRSSRSASIGKRRGDGVRRSFSSDEIQPRLRELEERRSHRSERSASISSEEHANDALLAKIEQEINNARSLQQLSAPQKGVIRVKVRGRRVSGRAEEG